MKIAVWKPELSVSVKSIDEDHQKLFDLINQLFEAMTKGKGKDIINSTVEELEKYTIYHFNREETYFRVTNYARGTEHTREHQIFKQKVAEFKKNLLSSDSSIAPEVLTFLRDWLLNHISKSDKAYEEHFKKFTLA